MRLDNLLHLHYRPRMLKLKVKIETNLYIRTLNDADFFLCNKIAKRAKGVDVKDPIKLAL